MKKENFKKSLMDNIIIENVQPPKSGGQHCGMRYPKQSLYSEDLNLKIELGYHRSQHKNIEILKEIFNLAIDKLID
jgi:hypothetical protein